MSSTSVISASDAHLLLTGKEGVAQRKYTTIYPDRVSEIEPFLGTLVTSDHRCFPHLKISRQGQLDWLATQRGTGKVVSMVLVEVYQTETSKEDLVPVRIIEDPYTDTLVMEQVSYETEAKIELAMDTRNTFHLSTEGFLKNLLAAGNHPLAERSKAAMKSCEDHLRQWGRLRLQRTLSLLGLGKIYKVSFQDLEDLTGDQFAMVLLELQRSFPDSPAAGALYFVGTGLDKEEFNEWFVHQCAKRNWRSSSPSSTAAAELDYALRMFRFSSVPVSSALLEQAHVDMAGFIRENIVHVTDADEARRLVLGTSTETLLAVLEGVPSRDFDVVFADAASGDIEKAAAFMAAFKAGRSPHDETIVAAYGELPSYIRILLIRQGAEGQHWTFTVHQAAGYSV